MNNVTNNTPVYGVASTIEQGEKLDYVHHFFLILNGYVGSTLCSFGILGNLLNIAVYTKMLRFNKTAITSFLLAISVADLLVLLFYLMYGVLCIITPPTPLLSLMDFKFEQAGTFLYIFYYIWTYPTNLCVTISTWYTVSVMVFRFIAIYYPLKANRWCSAHHAKIVMIIIAFISFVIYIPTWFLLKIQNFPEYNIMLVVETELSDNATFHYVYLIGIIEILNSFLPFIVCLILTILLLRTLWKKTPSLFERSTSSSSLKARRFQERKKITITLIAMVTVFIICTVPSLIWRVLRYYARSNVKSVESWKMARGIADIFQVINHAANFLIYFLSNERYRKICGGLLFSYSHKRSDLRMSNTLSRTGSGGSGISAHNLHEKLSRQNYGLSSLRWDIADIIMTPTIQAPTQTKLAKSYLSDSSNSSSHSAEVSLLPQTVC